MTICLFLKGPVLYIKSVAYTWFILMSSVLSKQFSMKHHSTIIFGLGEVLQKHKVQLLGLNKPTLSPSSGDTMHTAPNYLHLHLVKCPGQIVSVLFLGASISANPKCTLWCLFFNPCCGVFDSISTIALVFYYSSQPHTACFYKHFALPCIRVWSSTMAVALQFSHSLTQSVWV